MAGDIPIEERLRVDERPAGDSRAEEPDDVRVLHRFGRVAVVAGEPRDVAPDEDARRGAADVLRRLGGADLTERLGAEALMLRTAPEFVAAKQRRPRDGDQWDMAGACAAPPAPDEAVRRTPGTRRGGPAGEAPAGEAPAGDAPAGDAPAGSPGAALAVGRSDYLMGRVAVGVIIVNGPNPDLQFTDAERTKVVAEVQNGLSFFATQNPGARLSFHYDVRNVSIPTQPQPDPPDREALWRNPTMAALGYSPDWNGVVSYVEDLRTRLATQWTYCVFFVKYPLNHFAYAYFGGPHTVMQYANDGWGPDNIDRVFAHETGHIFWAPDEYAGSGCNCGGQWGRFGVPNLNCENCAVNGVACLMRANTFALCRATPRHLGWPGTLLRYQQGDPGNGIGGYDLRSAADRVFSFDYNHSGKNDHLALYRPGTGTFWILRNAPAGTFTPVYRQGDPGNGIGGYDLRSPADQAFAFDYDHSGKLDHIVLYRPGTGTVWILRNNGGTFTPVYRQGDPGSGIGGYDLRSPADRMLAFDYDHSGKLDHLVIYRPGTGTIWILRNNAGTFTPVYKQGDPGSGIGGYDLRSQADRVVAFDYDHSGRMDHLVLYRPGTGTIWILRNSGGTFTPVYRQGDPGSGIGGYDLRSAADRVLAFDPVGTGRSDHLVLYRPGTGTIWILRNSGGTFTPVYRQGDPGSGIGGYDLRSPADLVTTFDFDSTGDDEYLTLYRPGTGTIWMMRAAYA